MNHDSKPPLGLLEQAEQSMHNLAIPNGPSDQVVAELLGRLNKTPPITLVSRSPWTMRTRGLAAILALAATAVFAVFMYPTSTLALGDITQAIHNAKTLSYQVISNKVGNASEPSAKALPGQWKMLYKDPGLSRTEHVDGIVSVTNLSKKKIMTLQPAIKQATTIDMQDGLPGGAMPEASLASFPITLLEQGVSTGKPIADKTIAGRVAKGFEVQAGAVTMRIWGDSATKLPVLIEQELQLGGDEYLITMKDFEFSQDLSDDLFSTTVPEGYKLIESTFPKVDIAQVNQPPEVHAVNILKLHAARFDGKFPKKIDDPAFIANLGATYGLDTQGYSKAMAEVVPSLGASWTFRSSLNQFGYSGKAKLGDADTIVFWYLPQGATQYRVVYGDLRIDDVDKDAIPK